MGWIQVKNPGIKKFCNFKRKMEIILPQNNELLHHGKFYKFLSVKSALKTLQLGKLRYSKPTIFNDPLDCSELLFNFRIPDSNLTISPSTTSYDKEFSDYLMKTKYDFTMSEFINSIIPVIDLNNFTGSLNEDQKKDILQRFTQRIFSKEVIEKYRITCFSKKYYSKKSFLMWSHYAESHKGICLEFNNKREPDLKKLKKFIPVNVQYKSKLPNIYSQADFESNDWLWIKSILFKYEGEVRIIRKVKNANPSSSFSFPKKYLTKIIFGVNTSEKTIQLIKDILLNQYELDNIDFEKMYVDVKSWQLVPNRFDIHNMVPYKI